MRSFLCGIAFHFIKKIRPMNRIKVSKYGSGMENIAITKYHGPSISKNDARMQLTLMIESMGKWLKLFMN